MFLLKEIPIPNYIDKGLSKPSECTVYDHNSCMLLLDDGSLLIVSNAYDPNQDASFAFLTKFSNSGALLLQTLLPLIKGAERSYHKMVQSPDNSIVIIADKNIVVLDPENFSLLNQINKVSIAHISWDDEGHLVVGLNWNRWAGGQYADAIARSIKPIPTLSQTNIPDLSIVTQFNLCNEYLFKEMSVPILGGFPDNYLTKEISEKEELTLFNGYSECIIPLSNGNIFSQFHSFNKSITHEHRYVILDRKGNFIRSIREKGKKGSFYIRDKSKDKLLYKYGSTFAQYDPNENKSNWYYMNELLDSTRRSLSKFRLMCVNKSGQILLYKNEKERKYLVLENWDAECLNEAAKQVRKKS